MQPRFSPRQTEIVGLIAAGFSDKQIALALNVSQRTVRTQLERLFAANGLHSRAQAVHVWTIRVGVGGSADLLAGSLEPTVGSELQLPSDAA
jgi:DNA-binding CsgD family transcriptional regulator